MTGHIRKRQTKNGITWQIILEKGVDSKGDRIREYITVKGVKKEAERIMNEKINEYNKGIYIEPSKITVEEHLHHWIETYAKPNLSPCTVRGYLVNINKHTLPYIGSVPLQKLIPLQVQRMFEQLQAKKLSPRTIKYIHSTLREALQHAFKMQLIPRNPADFVTLPKQTRFKAKAYEESEAVQMLEKARGTDMEAVLHLAVGLGMRRGELLALRWQDIDFERNQLSVRQNLVYIDGEYIFRLPKSEAGIRTIDMPSSLSVVLKKHRKKQLEYKLFYGKEYKDNDLVCCRLDGSPYNPGSFSHKFDKFLKANGMRHIRLHDLRHTNASLMLQYNVSPKVASQRLGHSSIGITMDLYTHVLGDLNADAANKIDNGLFKKLVQEGT